MKKLLLILLLSGCQFAGCQQRIAVEDIDWEEPAVKEAIKEAFKEMFVEILKDPNTYEEFWKFREELIEQFDKEMDQLEKELQESSDDGLSSKQKEFPKVDGLTLDDDAALDDFRNLDGVQWALIPEFRDRLSILQWYVNKSMPERKPEEILIASHHVKFLDEVYARLENRSVKIGKVIDAAEVARQTAPWRLDDTATLDDFRNLDGVTWTAIPWKDQSTILQWYVNRTMPELSDEIEQLIIAGYHKFFLREVYAIFENRSIKVGKFLEDETVREAVRDTGEKEKALAIIENLKPLHDLPKVGLIGQWRDERGALTISRVSQDIFREIWTFKDGTTSKNLLVAEKLGDGFELSWRLGFFYAIDTSNRLHIFKNNEFDSTLAPLPIRSTLPAFSLLLAFEEADFTKDPNKPRVLDRSGNFNHGIRNNARYSADGKVGGAMRCNGLYLELPKPLLNSQADYTFTAWICPDTLAGELYKEQGSSNKFPLGYFRIEGDGSLAVDSWNSTYPGNWIKQRTKPGMIEAGRWNFVAVTLENGNTDGYETLWVTINDQTEVTISQLFDGSPKHTYIASGYAGLIDEVTIFDRALSKTEVETVRQMGIGGKSLASLD